MKFSNDKNINSFVKVLLNNNWEVVRRRKHTIIQSPYGYKIPVPSTPSDSRSFVKFKCNINRLNRKYCK